MPAQWIQAMSLVWMIVLWLVPSGSAFGQEHLTGPSFQVRAYELYSGIGGDPVTEVWRIDVSTASFTTNTVRMCRMFGGRLCVNVDLRASNPGYAFFDGNSICIDDPTPGVDVAWSLSFPQAWAVRGVNWTSIDAPNGAEIWTVSHDYTTGILDFNIFPFGWTTTVAGTMFAWSDNVIVNPILIASRISPVRPPLCTGDIYVVVE